MNDKGENYCLDFVQEFSLRLMRGGGARSPPFTVSTITYKVVVYAPAERANTFLLFLLYPYMYSVVSTGFGNNGDGPIIN